MRDYILGNKISICITKKKRRGIYKKQEAVARRITMRGRRGEGRVGKRRRSGRIK